MKNVKVFVAYTLSVIMTAVAVATYWVPELVNYVAAWSILNIILGIVVTVAFGIGSVPAVKAELCKREDWSEILKRSNSALNNPIKKIINITSKITSVCVLIYFGWVVTGVLLGITSIISIAAVKRMVKED